MVLYFKQQKLTFLHKTYGTPIRLSKFKFHKLTISDVINIKIDLKTLKLKEAPIHFPVPKENIITSHSANTWKSYFTLLSFLTVIFRIRRTKSKLHKIQKSSILGEASHLLLKLWITWQSIARHDVLVHNVCVIM